MNLWNGSAGKLAKGSIHRVLVRSGVHLAVAKRVFYAAGSSSCGFQADQSTEAVDTDLVDRTEDIYRDAACKGSQVVVGNKH